MPIRTFTARCTAGMAGCGRRCPIEAGDRGRLADHECHHWRVPCDRTPPCGCWAEESAVVIPMKRAVKPLIRRHAA